MVSGSSFPEAFIIGHVRLNISELKQVQQRSISASGVVWMPGASVAEGGVRYTN